MITTQPDYIVDREAELRCVISDLTDQVRERDAVLKQALEALEEYAFEEGSTISCSKAIAAIKGVLCQQ